MAQSVMCLPHKYDEDLSSQHLYKKQNMTACSYSSICRELETGNSFRLEEHVQCQCLLSPCLGRHIYVHQYKHVYSHNHIYRHNTHTHTQWVSFLFTNIRGNNSPRAFLQVTLFSCRFVHFIFNQTTPQMFQSPVSKSIIS